MFNMGLYVSLVFLYVSLVFLYVSLVRYRIDSTFTTTIKSNFLGTGVFLVFLVSFSRVPVKFDFTGLLSTII